MLLTVKSKKRSLSISSKRAPEGEKGARNDRWATSEECD